MARRQTHKRTPYTVCLPLPADASSVDRLTAVVEHSGNSEGVCISALELLLPDAGEAILKMLSLGRIEIVKNDRGALVVREPDERRSKRWTRWAEASEDEYRMRELAKLAEFHKSDPQMDSDGVAAILGGAQ